MKWISAKPLEGFSSLHEGVLWSPYGLKIGRISSVISFNLETGLPAESKSTMTVYSHPVDHRITSLQADYRIDELVQWGLDLTPFKSFQDYLNQLTCKQRNSYVRTENRFALEGCHLSILEGDWSDYADRAYELYQNVAHGKTRIYDRGFFREIAKMPSYKLICAWQGELLIGTVIMIAEISVIHSMGCGLDYSYSKKSFTYSKLHYAFIRYAIEKGTFKMADVGITADQAKKTLGMSPRPAMIGIQVKNPLLRPFLRLAALFTKKFLKVK